MELDLGVKDRLAIISMVPFNGTILEVSEILDLVKLLKFSDEEIKKINYREQDGKIMWDLDKEETRTFNLTFGQIQLLKKIVSKLDEEGKIDFNNFNICYRINKL